MKRLGTRQEVEVIGRHLEVEYRRTDGPASIGLASPPSESSARSMALPSKQPEHVGRYAIFSEIAKGGMASVHLARLTGPEGFSRVVAVKRMHRELLEDPDCKRMFVIEARLAARVRHPNVVPILDVQARGGELMIIMEYVHGEALHALLATIRKSKSSIPAPIVSAIMVAVLQGLHAAHEARDEEGFPLDMVHGDVSPQNVLVGADGVARVLDFGVAKAHRVNDPIPGFLKGKLSYMAPEVICRGSVTRCADVFSAAVVFWELLTGQKLFGGTTDLERLISVLNGRYQSPREVDSRADARLDRIVRKALAQDPAARYRNALEMAIEIERAVTPASQRIVGQWVTSLAADTLDERAELVKQTEIAAVFAVQSSVAFPGAWPTTGETETSATNASLASSTEPAPSGGIRRATGIGVVLVAASAVAWTLVGDDGFTDGVRDPTALPSTSRAPKAPDASRRMPGVREIRGAQAARTEISNASVSTSAGPPGAPSSSPARAAPNSKQNDKVTEPNGKVAARNREVRVRSASSSPTPALAAFEKAQTRRPKDFLPNDL